MLQGIRRIIKPFQFPQFLTELREGHVIDFGFRRGALRRLEIKLERHLFVTSQRIPFAQRQAFDFAQGPIELAPRGIDIQAYVRRADAPIDVGLVLERQDEYVLQMPIPIILPHIENITGEILDEPALGELRAGESVTEDEKHPGVSYATTRAYLHVEQRAHSAQDQAEEEDGAD